VPGGLVLADLVPIVAGLLAAGAAIGFLAGLFGVGGGAISVPIFYEVFRLTDNADETAMPLAVGTSLAMIVPTAFLSAREHARLGTVDRGVLRAWALPILAGVAIGSALARVAEPELFQGVFAVVASTLAIRMLVGKSSWHISDALPSRWMLSAYGTAIGLLSALMGIGGGALSTMLLTLYGRPIHEAVATSAGVGILIAVPGTLGYVLAGWGKPGLPVDAVGYVSLLAILVTLPTTLLLTRLGVRVAHALSRSVLSRLFGLFLLAVALRFFAAVVFGI
jgi:uncharacterized protein